MNAMMSQQRLGGTRIFGCNQAYALKCREGADRQIVRMPDRDADNEKCSQGETA